MQSVEHWLLAASAATIKCRPATAAAGNSQQAQSLPDLDAMCLTFLISGFACPLNTPAEVQPIHALRVGRGSAWGSSPNLAQPQAEGLRALLHVKGRPGKAFMTGCCRCQCNAGYHPPLTYFKASCCCHADRIGSGLLHSLIASNSADAQKPELRVMPCKVLDR